MKNTKNIEFIRWGNLNPIKHKEARNRDDDTWYHVAPRYKGIYAFPRGFVETFLLGGVCAASKNVRYLLDESGNKIDESDFWHWDLDARDPLIINDKYKKLLKKYHIKKTQLTTKYDDEDDKCYVIYNYSKSKIFRHTGEIWSHLSDYIDRKDILEESGAWVKTDYKTYCKALQRCNMEERFRSYIDTNKSAKEYSNVKSINGDPHTCPSWFSKDHYEVFIERIENKNN